MERINSSDNGTVIFTDQMRTKEILWEAYTGFVDNYNKFMLYRGVGKDNRTFVAGMYRYANFFYEEIRSFLGEFSFEKESIDKLEKCFTTNEQLKVNDYIFLRRFFADFMYMSGIKNIVYRQSTKSAYARSQER